MKRHVTGEWFSAGPRCCGDLETVTAAMQLLGSPGVAIWFGVHVSVFGRKADNPVHCVDISLAILTLVGPRRVRVDAAR